jgi:hypothetical protein
LCWWADSSSSSSLSLGKWSFNSMPSAAAGFLGDLLCFLRQIRGGNPSLTLLCDLDLSPRSRSGRYNWSSRISLDGVAIKDDLEVDREYLIFGMIWYWSFCPPDIKKEELDGNSEGSVRLRYTCVFWTCFSEDSTYFEPWSSAGNFCRCLKHLLHLTIFHRIALTNES